MMDNQFDNSDILKRRAIAVKNGDTPTIAAKGKGFVAEKILDIAFAKGVKVREDKDLTELLDAFDVDCPVPLEALHSVSLILERVYQENQSLSGSTSSDVSGAKPSLNLQMATALKAKSKDVNKEIAQTAPSQNIIMGEAESLDDLKDVTPGRGDRDV